MDKIIQMKDIVKHYDIGEERHIVLKNINFSVDRNEFVSILGPSGSGKSTLMNLLGCLDVPDEGSYTLAGKNVEKLNEKELARIRNKEIGFVFQSFQLLPRLTALENVELPMIYAKIPCAVRKKRALAILERIGLKDKTKNLPSQLSGGQQQRVAIARSVVTEPSILLADEPTGALDQNTGNVIMDLFRSLSAEGRTIIMITHDVNVANHADRIVHIIDGSMTEQGLN